MVPSAPDAAEVRGAIFACAWDRQGVDPLDGGEEQRRALLSTHFSMVLDECIAMLRSANANARWAAAQVLESFGARAAPALAALREAVTLGGDIEIRHGYANEWGYGDLDVRSVPVASVIEQAIFFIERESRRAHDHQR